MAFFIFVCNSLNDIFDVPGAPVTHDPSPFLTSILLRVHFITHKNLVL